MAGKYFKHFFIVLLFTFIFALFANPIFADYGDTTLKKGMKSSDVATLQEQLHKLGYFKDNKFTEYFGAITEASLMKFQKEVGLPANGIADDKTFVFINAKIKQQELLDGTSKATSEADVASRAMLTSRLVETAKKYLGAPYVWGASSGKAFDCSGFVMYIMKNYNLVLDHSASAQFKTGIKVEKKDLQPGDLVFFTTYKKGASHVGIYIGNNKFIHASSGVNKVTITDLDTNYYKQRYLGARRYPLSEKKDSSI